MGTAAAPHLHGEAGSPPGSPLAVSLADALAPAAGPSLFLNWGNPSWSPVFPFAARSVGSAGTFPAVLCQAQPGEQRRDMTGSGKIKWTLIKQLQCMLYN